LGNSNTIDAGTFFNSGAIVAAFVIVLTLKVKIFKFLNEVIDLSKAGAALPIKL